MLSWIHAAFIKQSFQNISQWIRCAFEIWRIRQVFRFYKTKYDILGKRLDYLSLKDLYDSLSFHFKFLRKKISLRVCGTTETPWWNYCSLLLHQSALLSHLFHIKPVFKWCMSKRSFDWKSWYCIFIRNKHHECKPSKAKATKNSNGKSWSDD